MKRQRKRKRKEPAAPPPPTGSAPPPPSPKEGDLEPAGPAAEKATSDVRSLAARLEVLEKVIRTAAEDSSKSAARISELDHRVSELVPLAGRVADLEADLAAVRREKEATVEELQRRLASEEEKSSRKLADAEARLTEILERIERLASEESAATDRLDALERRIAGSQEDRDRQSSGQEAKLAEILQRVDRLASEGSAAAVRLEALECGMAEARQPDTEVRTAAEPETAADPPARDEAESGVETESAAEPAPEPGDASAPEPAPKSPESAGTAVEGGSGCPSASGEETSIFGPEGEDGRGRYELVELLSRDAMGAVYRARERDAEGCFAVRFLPAQEDEERTAAIERQVQKAVGLPHPNVLQMLGTGRRGAQLFIEMDLIEAEPLGRARIEEVSRLCMIFRDVAEAVQYASDEGVFHGNLNPETILLGEDESGDHVYVREFGLAYLLESAARPAEDMPSPLSIRDPAFLPPEQATAVTPPLTAAVDVYGIGASLYACLAGRPPFEGKDARQIRSRVMMAEPPPLEAVRPDLRSALAVIVRRAMAKEAGLRYASARELADALTGFLEDRGTRILSRREPAEGT